MYFGDIEQAVYEGAGIVSQHPSVRVEGSSLVDLVNALDAEMTWDFADCAGMPATWF